MLTMNSKLGGFYEIALCFVYCLIDQRYKIKVGLVCVRFLRKKRRCVEICLRLDMFEKNIVREAVQYNYSIFIVLKNIDAQNFN